jgi:hypothetical protein
VKQKNQPLLQEKAVKLKAMIKESILWNSVSVENFSHMFKLWTAFHQKRKGTDLNGIHTLYWMAKNYINIHI